jgi:hypothetical protein
MPHARCFTAERWRFTLAEAALQCSMVGGLEPPQAPIALRWKTAPANYCRVGYERRALNTNPNVRVRKP